MVAFNLFGKPSEAKPPTLVVRQSVRREPKKSDFLWIGIGHILRENTIMGNDGDFGI
jgi:hypothetical protein